MTPYSDIYKRFLMNITDYTFSELDQLQGEELMLECLEKAISRFSNCKQDLSNRDNDLQSFNFNLTDIEKEILADIMTIEWSRHYLNHSELLEYKLGSKDYAIFSPANLLKEMRELHSYLVGETERLKMIYAYSGSLGDLA
jgi:hypothetical protein